VDEELFTATSARGPVPFGTERLDPLAEYAKNRSPEVRAERRRAAAEQMAATEAAIRATRDYEAEQFLGLERGELAKLRSLLRKQR
jgi:hypothetical protein